MNANQITAELLIGIPQRFPNVRAWRRNVGGGYPAQTVKAAIAALLRGKPAEALAILKRARIVIFGVPGEPDIDGIAAVNVGGLTLGIRVGIEVKAGEDRQSEEQKVCQAVWQKHGAIYIVARDVETTLAALAHELERRANR